LRNAAGFPKSNVGHGFGLAAELPLGAGVRCAPRIPDCASAFQRRRRASAWCFEAKINGRSRAVRGPFLMDDAERKLSGSAEAPAPQSDL